MAKIQKLKIVWDESDQIYIASCDEYPSLKTHGKTKMKALEELKTVITAIEDEQNESKKAFWDIVEKTWDKNKDIDSSVIEREVDKALEEVRNEVANRNEHTFGIFRRSEALKELEDLSYAIVQYLALVTWFGDHINRPHWDYSLSTWIKSLKLFHKGEIKIGNFTKELIEDALLDTIYTQDQKDKILVHLSAHEVTFQENPDWKGLEEAISNLSMAILTEK